MSPRIEWPDQEPELLEMEGRREQTFTETWDMYTPSRHLPTKCLFIVHGIRKGPFLQEFTVASTLRETSEHTITVGTG